MTSSTQNQNYSKSKIIKIMINVVVGVVIPIALALIMNQSVAQVLHEKNLPDGTFVVAANTATAIQSMNNNANAQTAPAIYGILVNDTADSDGYATEKKSVLPSNATKVYVTVQITDSVPGIKVSASINGVSNGMTTDPAITITSKSGNIMKAFTFTNNDKVWPKGDYKVDVSLSTGSTKTANFSIT